MVSAITPADVSQSDLSSYLDEPSSNGEGPPPLEKSESETSEAMRETMRELKSARASELTLADEI